MTNIQRICEACILNDIYRPEELEHMIENDTEIPVHTKNKWKEKGMKVKEGEKGIKTKLWKKKKGEEDKYFLVNATLFSESMVEDI